MVIVHAICHQKIKSHSIMDAINCYNHPIYEDEIHPIIDAIKNCYNHPFSEDENHPIIDA